MILSGWGRYPRVECRLVDGGAIERLPALIAASPSLIARGNGRSYGDPALNPTATLDMRRHDRLIAWDPATGVLRCEAGLLLADLLALFVPRGWFPAVTPGTRFVTIGGMIAADVHGKNHHGAGSFASCVLDLTLCLADGRVVTCSRDQEPELFAATCGGMGLTGVILHATIRLMAIETAKIVQETRRAPDLATVMALFEETVDRTYSVAWIDCLARGAALGRSLLLLGDHARLSDLAPADRATPLARTPRPARRVPVDFPSLVLNRYSIAAFNALYYRRGEPGRALVDYDPYFYPLDAIAEWNRIYGASGFVQYQCVLPKEASLAGLTLLLDRISRAGAGSFLAVLKLFGQQDGLLSFPMAGYTLALDFRADPRTFGLLVELDAIVRDHGGRIYLAKDARTGYGMIRAGYPGLDRFQAIRRSVDPAGKFASLQSERLGL